jgi:uncharacterized UPF0160 family protein
MMDFITKPYIAKGITHAGVFHADDVFSTALLRLINPKIEIERVFKVPEDIDVNATTGTVVYDIGDGKFDHHHGTLKKRASGCPKAAFGLLWEYYGPYLTKFDEKAWRIVDETLVRFIDEHDNGFNMGNPISVIFGSFNPHWDEKVDPNDQFITAVSIAEELLERHISSANATIRAEDTIAAFYDKSENHIMVMDLYAPWKDFIDEKNNGKIMLDSKNIWFVVYPSNRGGWCIQSYSSEKYPLPAEWLINLPDDMTFCHKARFLASVKTKEKALEYANMAVNRIIEKH